MVDPRRVRHNRQQWCQSDKSTKKQNLSRWQWITGLSETGGRGGNCSPPRFWQISLPYLSQRGTLCPPHYSLPPLEFSDPPTAMNPSFWAFLTDKEKDFCSRSIPKSLHSYIHRRLTRHNNCAALYTRDWEESEKKTWLICNCQNSRKASTNHPIPNLTARLEIVQDFHFRLGI